MTQKPNNVKTDQIFKVVSLSEIENLLSKLISIDSSQAPEYESGVVALLSRYFKEHDIPVTIQHINGKRFNIIARLKGSGAGNSLLLNAHTDTVPAYAMKDPFKMKITKNRIYGRGSVDVKGTMAAMAAVLVSMKQSNIPLKGDLIFAGTAGEESYSPGADFLVKSGIQAEFGIVGEPTNLKIGIAHKGVIWLKAEFKGFAAHGSVPEKGINSINKASQWLEKVRTVYAPSLKKLKHPILGHPSINIGMIEGGTRPVIVPALCSIKFERRMLPGETEKKIIGELQLLINDLKKNDPEMKGRITVLPVFHGVPHGPFEKNSSNTLVNILSKAYKKEFKVTTVPTSLGFWTDAALFSLIPGMEVVVCGPGNIAQAHSDEEYISRRQLYAAYNMYTQAALSICCNLDR